MGLQNFVDQVGPTISAAWFNVVDKLRFTVFADAATKAAARVAVTSDAQLEVANGGTGSRTPANAVQALQVGGGQTAEEAGAGLAIVDYSLPPGDVRRYGILGNDPLEDLYPVMQALSELPYKIVTQPQTTYFLTSQGLLFVTDNMVWEANGCTISTALDIDAITIGQDIDEQRTRKIQILGFPQLVQTGASTKSGWKMRHVYESYFEISTDGFYNLLEMAPINGEGCVYNEIHFGVMRNPGYVSVFINPTNSGWANENLFVGGRFSNSAGTPYAHIYQRNPVSRSDGIYRPNNNVFLKPSLEESGGLVDWAIVDEGLSNTYIQPRMEGTWANPIVMFDNGVTQVRPNVYIHEYAECITFVSGWYDNRFWDMGKTSKLHTCQRFKVASRSGAEAFTNPTQEMSRAYAPFEGIPLVEWRDEYYNSGTSQMLDMVNSRSAMANSYFSSGLASGEKVQSNGRVYECKVDHSSSATDEPGVGANWRDYWKLTNITLGVEAAWASGQSYTGREEKFRITGLGQGRFKSFAVGNSGTASTLGTVVKKVQVFDMDGVSLGYIPIYESIS